MGRSFEQLLRGKLDIVGYVVWGGRHVRSALAVVRIVPHTADPCIWSHPDRMMGLGVLGTTLRADETLPHRVE